MNKVKHKKKIQSQFVTIVLNIFEFSPILWMQLVLGRGRGKEGEREGRDGEGE